MSDLPLPLRVAENAHGIVDAQGYCIALVNGLVRIRHQRAAALVRAANAGPALRACAEALTDLRAVEAEEERRG